MVRLFSCRMSEDEQRWLDDIFKTHKCSFCPSPDFHRIWKPNARNLGVVLDGAGTPQLVRPACACAPCLVGKKFSYRSFYGGDCVFVKIGKQLVVEAKLLNMKGPLEVGKFLLNWHAQKRVKC